MSFDKKCVGGTQLDMVSVVCACAIEPAVRLLSIVIATKVCFKKFLRFMVSPPWVV